MQDWSLKKKKKKSKTPCKDPLIIFLILFHKSGICFIASILTYFIMMSCLWIVYRYVIFSDF